MGKFKYKYPSTLGNFIEKVKKTLKEHYRLVISLLIAIILPWILTLTFVVSLDLTHGLSDELFEELSLLFRMTIFYSFNTAFSLPVLGTWFWPSMFIWAISGFFLGYFSRKMETGLISALIGIGITFLLYMLLIFLPEPSFPNDMNIDSVIFTRLYSELSLEAPYNLLFHILFFSCAFPVLILFTMIGNMIKPVVKVYPTLPPEEPKRIEGEIKKNPESELEAAIPSELEIKEIKKLRGFAGIVYKQFHPLNDNEQFKEEFRKTNLNILLNPIDQLVAVMLIFENGTVDIEEYKKFDPIMRMDKKKIGFDAMLQVSTQMLFDIAAGKLSTRQLLKAARKDKNIIVKGKLKLTKLTKAMKILAKS
ncbi:MAG: hypothetical protein ACFE8A_09665 [Candidatus Hodarchaeota archaeon]